jgi:HlyD family secretion protein
MRRFLRLGLGALGVAAIAVGAWAYFHYRPITVEVAAVERDVPVQVFGLGTVEARILSRIGFEVGGALIEINVDHGDRVELGAVLARLHSEEQAARVAKAEAVLAEARANQDRARANVTRAEALLAQRRSVSARREALVARGATSEEVVEDARAAAEIAAAELAVARSDVAVAEAAVADAQAQVQMESVLLDHYVLRAPYDALVISRNKELGAVVAPGEALFTVIDPATVWTRAYVDEALAGDLQVGQRAEVHLRSLPRQVFNARVQRIEIESDRVTEERRVYVKCDQCPRDFHLGEQAEVFITVAGLESALLIPETAIEQFDGVHGFVWTVHDGVLHRQQVSFGHRLLDGRAALTEGLPAGARVVVTPGSGFREGRAVRVSEGSPP